MRVSRFTTAVFLAVLSFTTIGCGRTREAVDSVARALNNAANTNNTKGSPVWTTKTPLAPTTPTNIPPTVVPTIVPTVIPTVIPPVNQVPVPAPTTPPPPPPLTLTASVAANRASITSYFGQHGEVVSAESVTITVTANQAVSVPSGGYWANRSNFGFTSVEQVSSTTIRLTGNTVSRSPEAAVTLFVKLVAGAQQVVFNSQAIAVSTNSIPTAVVHRRYRSAGADHLLTYDPNEGSGYAYAYEGPAFQTFQWHVPSSSVDRPLYRCFTGVWHFVTTNPACDGWIFQGHLGWIASQPVAGTRPLYRIYHSGNGDQLSTADTTEFNILMYATPYLPWKFIALLGYVL